MTLDEAIKHCEEVAKEQERHLKVYKNINEDRPLFKEEETECRLCAEEHRQLAEWLKELRALREQQTAKHHDEEIIKQLCYMVDDVNINEIYAHNKGEELFSWLRSWRDEMRRLINQLDMREVTK